MSLSSVPPHLFRCSTVEARKSLASRFGLPYAEQMQDWEWEVADASRLTAFLRSYEHDPLTEDERFSLMEMILESLEETESDSERAAIWPRVAGFLDAHVEIHAHTIWYWSKLDDDDSEKWFRVTVPIREVLRRHQAAFAAAVTT